MNLLTSPNPPKYEDNFIKLCEFNLGVFGGVPFEIRTFLAARNHMILSYEIAFSSTPADANLHKALIGLVAGGAQDKHPG